MGVMLHASASVRVMWMIDKRERKGCKCERKHRWMLHASASASARVVWMIAERERKSGEYECESKKRVMRAM